MTCTGLSLQKVAISEIKVSHSRKFHFHGKLTFKSEPVEKVSRGKAFQVAHANFQDEHSEIRMSFYDGQIAGHHKALELNKSYDVKRFAVGPSDTKTTLLNHKFELRPLAGKLTELKPLEAKDDVKVPAVEPSRIVDIENMEKDKLVDILGVISHVGQLEDVPVNSSCKRVIRVVDQSGCEIDATLWGTDAENFNGAVNSVINAKRFKTSDYRGHSLTTCQYTTVEVNPSLPETQILQNWYSTAKSSIQFRTLSTDAYKRQTLAVSLNVEKPTDFFLAKVNIKSIDRRRDPFYMACNKCFKKVIEQEDGMFLCNGGKCDPEMTFSWRLILKAKLVDNTAQVDADFFTDAAEKLLGLKVDDARSLYEDDTSGFFAKLDSVTSQQFEIKFRSKSDANGRREFTVIEVL